MSEDTERAVAKGIERQQRAAQAARQASWAGGIITAVVLIIALAALGITNFWAVLIAAAITMGVARSLGAAARYRVLNE